MAQILVIEDDQKISRLLERIISALGHKVTVAGTLADGLKASTTQDFDVVLLDLTLPDGHGLSVLSRLSDTNSSPEVIIVTGTGDQSGAELAFHSGVWDFVPKPFLPEDVTTPLTRALQYREEKEGAKPPQMLDREGVIGDSSAIKACLELVAQAAVTDSNVLINGETGVGKELFARAIHRNGTRAFQPLVVVDCAAHPEQLIESALFGHEKGAFTGAVRRRTGLIGQADKGTLFLDEVGELTLPMQKAFLRVLQGRTYRPIGASTEIASDFRLVAATNRNLDEMVGEGRFRLDLLHRLRSLVITLPPLRKHPEDIDALVSHYLQQTGARSGGLVKGYTPEFINSLKSYEWPGNVRELFNTLDYAIAHSGGNPTLYQRNLPPHVRMSKIEGRLEKKTAVGSDETPDLDRLQELPALQDFRENLMESAEKQYLTELMRRTKGRIKDACRIAGLSESRLHALLKKYDTPRFR